ncbi:hypothetical protein MKW92_035406, partial [Papaver armeniacum]
TEKGHLQQIEDLSKESKSLKLKLSARDSKYLRLKEKLVVSVSNTKKNALRQRNQQVQKNADDICTKYNLPLVDFGFPDVPPNEEDVYTSSSEEEYEEEEEETDQEFEDELGDRSTNPGSKDNEEDEDASTKEGEHDRVG